MPFKNIADEVRLLSAQKLSSLTAVLIYLRNKVENRSEHEELQERYLLEISELLDRIMQNGSEFLAYQKLVKSGFTILGIELAIMGDIAKNEDVSPSTIEITCITMGSLLKLVPFTLWPKNFREYVLKVLSMKIHKYIPASGHQAMLSMLLLGRMILGNVLLTKLKLKHLSSAYWIGRNKRHICENGAVSLYTVDNILIQKLRDTFGNKNVLGCPELEDEIFRNALPLIVSSIDAVYSTKHNDIRSVALDCIFCFVGFLDSWSKLYTSTPALSSNIANTLHKRGNIGSDCIVGCIRVLEIIICKCLNNSAVHDFDESSSSQNVNEKFKKYIGNTKKIFEIVSNLKSHENYCVREAVCDFLGGVCLNCSPTMGLDCNKIFSTLMSLFEDHNDDVIKSSRRNLVALSNNDLLKKTISTQISSTIDNLSLVKSYNLDSIAENIDTFNVMVQFLPFNIVSLHVDIILEKLIMCIIEISNKNMVQFVTFTDTELDAEKFIIIRHNTPPNINESYKSSQKLLKSLKSLICSLASADFSYSYKIIKLVSHFLGTSHSTNKSLETGTWILYRVLNALSRSNGKFDCGPLILNVMDIIYPLITQLKVSKFISGDYSLSSLELENYKFDNYKTNNDKVNAFAVAEQIKDDSPSSSTCIVNALNCVGIAFKLLDKSMLHALLPRWLYVTLTKLNYSIDVVNITANNVLYSMASTAGFQGNLDEAVDSLITSHANYILNASISMLLQPKVDIEAFYLLISVIKCRGKTHLKDVDCIVDELVRTLSNTWVTNDEIFDHLVAVIDLLSQKMLDIYLKDNLYTFRGLVWMRNNFGDIHSIIPSIKPSSPKRKPENRVKLMHETLNSHYNVPLSLLQSCSTEFQKFYIENFKPDPKLSAADSQSQKISLLTDDTSTENIITVDDDINRDLCQMMALKIIPSLHRYAGSYKVHIRKSTIDSISRLFAIFARNPDKILPEIHKKWLPIINRLSDNSFVVIHSAASAILIMCQIDSSFVKKKVNQDVFPRILHNLRHLEANYRKSSGFPNDGNSNDKLIPSEKFDVNGASANTGKLAALLLSFASEMISLNVLPDQEQSREFTILALRLLNSNNYTIDLSEYAGHLLEAILNTENSMVSDFAWILSWIAAGAKICRSHINVGYMNRIAYNLHLRDICFTEYRFSWFIKKYDYIISSDINHRIRILLLLMDDEFLIHRYGIDFMENLRSILNKKDPFDIGDGYVYWTFNTRDKLSKSIRKVRR